MKINFKYNNLNLMIKIFFLLIIFILILFNFYNYSKYLSKKELRKRKKDIYKFEKYYKLCNKGILINKKHFQQINNPKISIITPIYNKGKYIQRYLRSIQNQVFNDIEIILIDDYSTDNSTTIIEKFQKEDERIILIKHKKNKGTLISRNEGVLKSKGEYLIFIDPDDLISKDILKLCYNMAKKYDYDLIRFNLYEGNENINLEHIIKNLTNKPIYQPELSLYLFYGLGKLEEIDYYITNKLIKKIKFIETLNLIDKFYLNQFMIDCEDGLINSILYKLSNSYYLIKELGYFYNKNTQSITNENESNFLKRLKSNFLYIKFIFQYTKNNIIEKNIANYIFSEIYSVHKDEIIDIFKEINDTKFYIEVMDLYINSDYIPIETKNIILNILKLLIKK